MKTKTEKLDDATFRIIKKMLEMPPKDHERMKIGRPANSRKRRDPKGRDVSAKPRTV